MGCRAHVHTKHEIVYGSCHFNWASDRIKDWLVENGVYIFGNGDEYDCGAEWEIDKYRLKNIPDEAFHDIGTGEDKIAADELREFVHDLLAAPTGDYAYVSWF